MAPMGRPKIDNPKATQLGVRLDAEAIEKLEYCMKALGKTKAEVLRIGLEKVYQELTGKNE